MKTYNGTYDVYGGSYRDQYPVDTDQEQSRQRSVKLGERQPIIEDDQKEPKDDSISKGMDAYNKYKKYTTKTGTGGESLTTASREGVTQLGGESPYQIAVDESLSLGAEPGGAVEMAPESSYQFGGGGAGGESGGMGSLGYVLAYIYGADQIKKKYGGYEESGGDLKFDENTHNMYRTEKKVTETPWDDKSFTEKVTDAPGSVGAAGGDPVLHIGGLLADEDTALGKYTKEMARIEEQAFEPISKIISWLGLDM